MIPHSEQIAGARKLRTALKRYMQLGDAINAEMRRLGLLVPDLGNQPRASLVASSLEVDIAAMEMRSVDASETGRAA